MESLPCAIPALSSLSKPYTVQAGSAWLMEAQRCACWECTSRSQGSLNPSLLWMSTDKAPDGQKEASSSVGASAICQGYSKEKRQAAGRGRPGLVLCLARGLSFLLHGPRPWHMCRQIATCILL